MSSAEATASVKNVLGRFAASKWGTLLLEYVESQPSSSETMCTIFSEVVQKLILAEHDTMIADRKLEHKVEKWAMTPEAFRNKRKSPLTSASSTRGDNTTPSPSSGQRTPSESKEMDSPVKKVCLSMSAAGPSSESSAAAGDTSSSSGTLGFGSRVCVLSKVPSIVPRGAQQIELYADAFVVSHATQPDTNRAVVEFSNVEYVFRLDQVSSSVSNPNTLFVLILKEEVDYGKKKLKQLMFSIKPLHQMDATLEFDESMPARLRNLGTRLSGKFAERFAELIVASTGLQINESNLSIFKSVKGKPAVKYFSNAREGYMYPLPAGIFFFRGVNSCFVPLTEIDGVQFLRGGSAGTRTIDLQIDCIDGEVHRCDMIEKGDSERFSLYVTQVDLQGIKAKREKELEAKRKAEGGDESSDDMETETDGDEKEDSTDESGDEEGEDDSESSEEENPAVIGPDYDSAEDSDFEGSDSDDEDQSGSDSGEGELVIVVDVGRSGSWVGCRNVLTLPRLDSFYLLFFVHRRCFSTLSSPIFR